MEKPPLALEDSLRAVGAELSATLASIDKSVFDFQEFPVSFMGKAVRARFTLLMAGALGSDRAKRRRRPPPRSLRTRPRCCTTTA